MATELIQEEDLKRHIGRRLTSTDVIVPGPANLLRLAFARPEPELREGDALPPGWQALYFLPRFGPQELRPDGSPISAGVVPSMPLPRRMFAGERVRYHRPLRIGETARREIELADMAVKRGGTGTLVFATVMSRISARAAAPRAGTGWPSRRSAARCSARRSRPGSATRPRAARRRPATRPGAGR